MVNPYGYGTSTVDKLALNVENLSAIYGRYHGFTEFLPWLTGLSTINMRATYHGFTVFISLSLCNKELTCKVNSLDVLNKLKH